MTTCGGGRLAKSLPHVKPAHPASALAAASRITMLRGVSQKGCLVFGFKSIRLSSVRLKFSIGAFGRCGFRRAGLNCGRQFEAGCGRRFPDPAHRQLDGRAPPRAARYAGLPARRPPPGHARAATVGIRSAMQGRGGSTELGGACLGRARNPACRDVEQHKPGQGAFDPASGQGRGLCRMVAVRHLPAVRPAADGAARELAAGPDHHPGVDADALPGLPRPCRSRDPGQQPIGLARPGGAGVGIGELRLRRAALASLQTKGSGTLPPAWALCVRKLSG